MTGDSESVSAAVERLRAARASSPPSLVRRMMDDPALYRRTQDEVRERARRRHPHLFDPGLIQRLTSTDVVFGDSGEDAEPVELVKRKPRGPNRFRKRDLARIADAARSAGETIERVEVDPDGKITLILATPGTDGTLTPEARAWEKATEQLKLKKLKNGKTKGQASS